MADLIDRAEVLAKIHWLSNADWTKAERRAASEIATAIAALAPAEAGGVEATKCRHCGGAGYLHGMRCNCKDTPAPVDALVKAAERAERIIANGQPDKIADAGAILRAAIAAYHGGAK